MKRIGAIIILCMIIFGSWYVVHTRAGTIRIERGDSITAVSQSLANARVVVHPFVARIGFLLFNGEVTVHPGVVTIQDDCSLRCVVRIVTSNKRNSLRVTLKEGQDTRDLAALLIEKKIIKISRELYALVGTPARFPIGKEGYLFPDTYDVDEDGGVSALVEIMLQNFDRKFSAEMRAQAAASGQTIHDVVTIASILEKEVRGQEDRKKVADILWRRVRAGWGLQVDASVNYVTGKSDRFTTAQDRALISAWNTYKHRGLPPGPIANPGLETLRAALEPTPNQYWFYLTAPDGTVHYGHTLEEHAWNKQFLR